jgi:hypothetical protein
MPWSLGKYFCLNGSKDLSFFITPPVADPDNIVAEPIVLNYGFPRF